MYFLKMGREGEGRPRARGSGGGGGRRRICAIAQALLKPCILDIKFRPSAGPLLLSLSLRSQYPRHAPKNIYAYRDLHLGFISSWETRFIDRGVSHTSTRLSLLFFLPRIKDTASLKVRSVCTGFSNLVSPVIALLLQWLLPRFLHFLNSVIDIAFVGVFRSRMFFLFGNALLIQKIEQKMKMFRQLRNVASINENGAYWLTKSADRGIVFMVGLLRIFREVWMELTRFIYTFNIFKF